MYRCYVHILSNSVHYRKFCGSPEKAIPIELHARRSSTTVATFRRYYEEFSQRKRVRKGLLVLVIDMSPYTLGQPLREAKKDWLLGISSHLAACFFLVPRAVCPFAISTHMESY